MSSVAAAAAARAALKAEARAKRAEFRRLEERRRREGARRRLSGAEADVIVATRLLAPGEDAGAARTACKELLQRKGLEHSDPVVERSVDEAVADCPLLRQAELLAGGSARGRWARRRATSYLLEHRAQRYVDAANENVGVAPSTEQVLKAATTGGHLSLDAVASSGDGPPPAHLRLTGNQRVWAHRCRARLGLKLGKLLIRPSMSAALRLSKATASWRWYNYKESLTPPGKRVLRVNLDETSVLFWYGHQRGWVSTKKRLKRRGRRTPTAFATLSTQRKAVTHVGLVCDDEALQRLLPQYIIVNEKTMTSGEAEAIRGSLPGPIRLLRLQSAWNTEDVLLILLRDLHLVLEPHAEELHVLLLWGTVAFHWNDRLLKACERYNFELILIPALLTHVLQPLDTHCFAHFKNFLRQEYRRVQLEQEAAVVGASEWMQILVRAIERVLNGRSWRRAFDETGYGASQARLSDYVLKELELSQTPAVGSAPPTVDDLMLCLPARRHVPPVLLRLAAAAVALAPPLAPPALPPPPVPPWFGRTRSTAALALPAPASSTPASASAAAASAGPAALAPSIPEPHAGDVSGPISRRTRRRLRISRETDM